MQALVPQRGCAGNVALLQFKQFPAAMVSKVWGREIYGGAMGYFSFSGNMDLAIAIRTLVIRDGKVHLQAGAGIVADSDPASEYQETVNKAMAVVKAIETVERGLD